MAMRFLRALAGAMGALVVGAMIATLVLAVRWGMYASRSEPLQDSDPRFIPLFVVFVFATLLALLVIVSLFRSAWKVGPPQSATTAFGDGLRRWSWRLLYLACGLLCIGAGFAIVSERWRLAAVGALAGDEISHLLPSRVWIADLQDPDPDIRLRAVEALKSLSRIDETAVLTLEELLMSGDPGLRAAIVELAETRGPEATPLVPALVFVLGDEVLHRAPAEALGAIGAAAVPELIVVLERRSAEPPSEYPHRGGTNRERAVRMAVVALGEIGPQAAPAAAELVEILEESRRPPKPLEFSPRAESAAYALRQIRPASAIPSLIQLLDDPSENVRLLAVSVLESQPPGAATTSAVPALQTALSDPLSEVRWQSARTLGHWKASAKAALPQLRSAMSDEHERVRLEAARAVWKVSGDADSAVRVLLDLVQQKQREELDLQSDELWRAIGEIGPPAKPAIPALLEQIETSRDQVSVLTAAAAVRGIDPPWFTQRVMPVLITALEEAKRSNDQSRMQEICKVLGASGADAASAVPVMIDMLHGSDETRDIAVGTLQELGPVAKSAVPALLDGAQLASSPTDRRRMLDVADVLSPGAARQVRLWAEWWSLIIPCGLVIGLSFVAAAIPPRGRGYQAADQPDLQEAVPTIESRL